MNHTRNISSGISALDEILQHLRLGDNVVWQVDSMDEYAYFAQAFMDQALSDGRKCASVRFAKYPSVVERKAGIECVEIDPGVGFDAFSGEVHRLIDALGREVCYVFDNLSILVAEWATDELLANFFQITCPHLFELDTVAYFALKRGQHAHSAVARIRDTTQVLLDVYRVNEDVVVHPLKVWDRYSPQMFLPHLVTPSKWIPVFHSGTAAALSTVGRQFPLPMKTGSTAPWDSVYERLMQYRSRGGADDKNLSPEIMALKQEMIRMLMGNHPIFSALADRFFTLEDLLQIRGRLIGSGRIGGKAAGMLLARRILIQSDSEVDFASVLEAHDSFYIGSDVFFSFLVHNDLFRMRLQMAKKQNMTPEEFEEIEKRFVEGSFPEDIIEQYRNMLDHFGQAPIIVRSSSLLEDSFGNAFAGKYRSEYCVNQGTPEQRLDAFLKAVKLVYASALNVDALLYRRRRGLSENDEQMAILVQRVAGMPYRRFFFPCLAGVAFSRNLYAWTDRIDPQKGIIRMVFGLGTRAVNRVSGDYPRMIAIGNPLLRPEIGMEIAKYSQRKMDVLDIDQNTLTTRVIDDVIADQDYPHWYLLVSVIEDGQVREPYLTVDHQSSRYVITFNNLIRNTEFVRIMGHLLGKLEMSYGHPIDTEFTVSIDDREQLHINLLQCRPMWLPGSSEAVRLPESIADDRILFRASRLICGGIVRNIRYIVYVDPLAYAAVPTATLKKSVGRVIGRINEHPRMTEAPFIMMGPGRWGSSNIDLGANVSYADIHNTAVLVELGLEETGHVPEVSYGTHFFQDIVEAQIVYMPVFPRDAASAFNTGFFTQGPNILAELIPNAHPLADVIRVIDVSALTNGSYAHVVADSKTQRAICYLE